MQKHSFQVVVVIHAQLAVIFQVFMANKMAQVNIKENAQQRLILLFTSILKQVVY